MKGLRNYQRTPEMNATFLTPVIREHAHVKTIKSVTTEEKLAFQHSPAQELYEHLILPIITLHPPHQYILNTGFPSQQLQHNILPSRLLREQTSHKIYILPVLTALIKPIKLLFNLIRQGNPLLIRNLTVLSDGKSEG